ncbi:hypothetical protein BY996DRAFT_6760801 [Phakopsora pachyrhizi]|nr:hypothetical protein BY996DRAFT_6760801 [Phakopsora pachyrhizi]
MAYLKKSALAQFIVLLFLVCSGCPKPLIKNEIETAEAMPETFEGIREGLDSRNPNPDIDLSRSQLNPGNDHNLDRPDLGSQPLDDRHDYDQLEFNSDKTKPKSKSLSESLAKHAERFKKWIKYRLNLFTDHEDIAEFSEVKRLKEDFNDFFEFYEFSSIEVRQQVMELFIEKVKSNTESIMGTMNEKIKKTALHSNKVKEQERISKLEELKEYIALVADSQVQNAMQALQLISQRASTDEKLLKDSKKLVEEFVESSSSSLFKGRRKLSQISANIRLWQARNPPKAPLALKNRYQIEILNIFGPGGIAKPGNEEKASEIERLSRRWGIKEREVVEEIINSYEGVKQALEKLYVQDSAFRSSILRFFHMFKKTKWDAEATNILNEAHNKLINIVSKNIEKSNEKVKKDEKNSISKENAITDDKEESKDDKGGERSQSMEEEHTEDVFTENSEKNSIKKTEKSKQKSDVKVAEERIREVFKKIKASNSKEWADKTYSKDIYDLIPFIEPLGPGILPEKKTKPDGISSAFGLKSNIEVYMGLIEIGKKVKENLKPSLQTAMIARKFRLGFEKDFNGVARYLILKNLNKAMEQVKKKILEKQKESGIFTSRSDIINEEFLKFVKEKYKKQTGDN